MVGSRVGGPGKQPQAGMHAALQGVRGCVGRAWSQQRTRTRPAKVRQTHTPTCATHTTMHPTTTHPNSQALAPNPKP